MITSRQLMVWKWWERMVFLNEFWLKGPWIFIFFVLWSTCNLACSFAFFPFTASHSEQLTFSRHIRFDTFSLNENPIRKLKIFYFSLPQISHNFQSGQLTFRFSSSCTGVCQKVIKYRARWKIDDLLRLDFFFELDPTNCDGNSALPFLSMNFSITEIDLRCKLSRREKVDKWEENIICVLPPCFLLALIFPCSSVYVLTTVNVQEIPHRANNNSTFSSNEWCNKKCLWSCHPPPKFATFGSWASTKLHKDLDRLNFLHFFFFHMNWTIRRAD